MTVRTRQYTRLLLTVALSLTFAAPAFANTIAPTAYLMPGVIQLQLGPAVPASVLAAFLERPFVTAAGFRTSALRYSLRANAVSLIIGYLTLPIAVPAVYAIGVLWSIAAVAMSIFSEGLYLRSRSDSPFLWAPIIVGNLFSSLVLVLIPFIAEPIEHAWQREVWQLKPFHEWLWWGSVVGGAVVLIGSFFKPRVARSESAVAEAKVHWSAAPPGDGDSNPV